MCQGEKFIERLGARVGPSMFAGRAGEHIVIFAEGNFHALAINFAGRSDQHRLAIARAMFENRIGAAEDCLDCLDALKSLIDSVAATHRSPKCTFAREKRWQLTASLFYVNTKHYINLIL